MNPKEHRLALARLPAHVREATRLFRELTGHTAVTSFRAAVSDLHKPPAMTPPMHPLCASRLRATREGPCEEEWERHLDSSLRSRAVQRHVCPLGLRCACIPVDYRGMLVGVAKCVADKKTDSRRFSRAVRILELAISRACQDFCVSVQSDELESLRQRIGQLQRCRAGGAMATQDRRPATTTDFAETGGGDGRPLVERALDYIAFHYLEQEVSLAAISRELGVTEKYLTCLFTRVVGQHMHGYILQLRIQQACRVLRLTDKPIKRVAYESGFRRVEAFRRSFRRYVGVAPRAYRGAFARG